MTIALTSIAVVVPAHAEDFYWWFGQSGDFGVPSFWFGGEYDEYPEGDDVAIFDQPSIYTVSFTEPHETDRVLIRSGFVTFSLDEGVGYTLLNQSFLSPGIAVAEDNGDIASLTVEGGALAAGYTSIGHFADAFGTLNIQGPDAALISEQHLNVAEQGIGFFNLTDGATASNTFARVANAGASYGFAEISGEGTTWTCDGPLVVGLSGVGDLAVNDGATVSCFDAVVGQNVGSQGLVTVSGSGTNWTIDGTLDIGLAAYGELIIENGASVTNTTFALVGGFPEGVYGFAIGEVTITDPGTSWLVDGDLYVGLVPGNGIGRLSLGGGGRLIVAGDLQLNPVSDLFGHDDHTFTLMSADDYEDAAIEVEGVSLVSSIANVELAESYTPAPGDSFVLMSAAAGIDLVDFGLPDLPIGLDWSVNQTETILEITVIQTLVGDITGDGIVDVADLLALLGAWGPCEDCAEDLDGDGSVDVNDLLVVLGHWSA